ncbi:MAG: cytochrome C [Gammaproteobacteria bacterium]|nr:cytochrome C [Gammaproteobacteria bacterium]
MIRRAPGLLLLALVAGCAADRPESPMEDYEEVDAVTVLDAPSPVAGTYSPQGRLQVERGEYLVELLGCGSCHTNGALIGEPDMEHPLAGSRTGIAYSSPLDSNRPGVVYPSNITPEKVTGIGDWSDAQIASAVRAGIGRHGSRRIATMPWLGYAKLRDEDVGAIVSYLRSIPPIKHEVPASVEPGHAASHPFVYFGVYRSKP